MPAGGAGIDMAAQCRRTTVHNSLRGFVLLQGQAMRALVVSQVAAQHIGYLKRRPAHPFAAGFQPVNRVPVESEHSNAGTGPWCSVACGPGTF